MLPTSSPSRKRKWGEMGEQIVCAAAGGIADRAVSAVVGSYGELRSFDEQLEHLEWLVMEVSATVVEAERVGGNTRSWPLRRWLRCLRDAASEGRAVARTLRRRGRAGGPAAAAGSGDALWLVVVRAAKKALLGDGDMDRISRTTRKLERAAAGMGTFLKLLEPELTGRPRQAAAPVAVASTPPAAQVPGASSGGGLSPGRGTARLCKRTKRNESLEWREEAGALRAETTTAPRRSPAYAPSPDRHEAGRLRGLVLRIHTAAATAYVITARCGFGGVFLEAFQE